MQFQFSGDLTVTQLIWYYNSKLLLKGRVMITKVKTYFEIISETQNFDCMRGWGYKICKIGVWLIWDLLWCQAGAEGWGDFNRKCKSWIIEDLGELLLEVKLNPGCCPVVSPAVACLLYNSFCAPTWSSYTPLPPPPHPLTPVLEFSSFINPNQLFIFVTTFYPEHQELTSIWITWYFRYGAHGITDGFETQTLRRAWTLCQKILAWSTPTPPFLLLAGFESAFYPKSSLPHKSWC